MTKRNLIGIFGLGVFGRAIAKSLEESDIDVIAVDRDDLLVNDFSQDVFEAVIGDFTDRQFLEDIGIADCQAVVVATGSNLEASSLAVLHLASIGIPKIICKAGSNSYAQILKAVGATDIIMPERESGRRLAKSLIQDNISNVLDLDEETSIIDFYAPPQWNGNLLSDMDIRNQYQLNIIGYRNSKHGPIHTDIHAQTRITEGQILVAIAPNKIINQHDFLTHIK